MTPPLPFNSRMLPTMAHIRMMPDIWGSSASSTTTGSRGARGTISSRTTFWYSQRPKLPATCRTPGLPWSTRRGVRLARWAVSRIISNFTSSEACNVGRPRMLIHRRQPFNGSQNRTITSKTRLMRYPGHTNLRINRRSM